MAKRKKGMTFIPYDYEAAYNKSLEDMNEFFVEQMFKHGKKVVYALKEIRAGDQFEVEIYPQFKKMDEVPPEGRSIKKDNDKAQRNLNDKNATTQTLFPPCPAALLRPAPAASVALFHM